MPKSFLNLRIPLVFKISIADMIATLSSVLMVENYEVMRINSSKFLIKDKEQSILGTKINNINIRK